MNLDNSGDYGGLGLYEMGVIDLVLVLIPPKAEASVPTCDSYFLSHSTDRYWNPGQKSVLGCNGLWYAYRASQSVFDGVLRAVTICIGRTSSLPSISVVSIPSAYKLSDNAASSESAIRAIATMPLELPELRDSRR